MAAEIPINKPDVLIAKATYGVQVHASKKEREARFVMSVICRKFQLASRAL
jgi:Cft2 family RNA processing exonuclease